MPKPVSVFTIGVQGPPGFGVGGVTVGTIAQLTALSAASFAAGTFGYVIAPVGGVAPGYFEYQPLSTVPPDANNIVAATPSGNWLRMPAMSPATVQVVNSATVPAAQASDRYVTFDSSTYQTTALQYVLWSVPFIGQKVTFAWPKWSSGLTENAPIVFFGGNQGTPFSQGAQTSGALASQASMPLPGSVVSVLWNGANWVLA